MRLRRCLLVAVVALAACSAVAPPRPQVQDAIAGLTGVGYRCDAGTSVSHSDLVTWRCDRDVAGGTASVTIESAATDVRVVAVEAPRANGNEAAGAMLAEAFSAAGVGGGVETSIVAWIREWDGGTVSGTFGQVDVEMRAIEDRVELTVELAAS